jgi:hypothetical protein
MKGDVMSEQNKQVVREYYERVLNGRDLDAVGEFFVDERIVEASRAGASATSRPSPTSTSRSTT